MVVTLHDGTPALIRPIRPDDKAALQDGLRRLSPETVRRRFLASKPRFSPRELRYLTEVDGHDHIALVAEVDGEIVAVARGVRLAERPDTAEMAIVVADCVQRLGLGSALADALAGAAVDAGVQRLAATMEHDNAPARALVRRIARRLRGGAVRDLGVHAGVRELAVELVQA